MHSVDVNVKKANILPIKNQKSITKYKSISQAVVPLAQTRRR